MTKPLSINFINFAVLPEFVGGKNFDMEYVFELRCRRVRSQLSLEGAVPFTRDADGI